MAGGGGGGMCAWDCGKEKVQPVIDWLKSEARLWGDVYEDTSFEAWDISYGEDGIIVEFPPYMYGPFASGFIEIPISYEELGMDMN